MAVPRVQRLVWLLPAMSSALGVATVVFALWSPKDRRDPLPEVVLTGVMLVAWAVVGTAIARRLPRHPVGWLVGMVGALGPAWTAATGYAAVESALPARDWVYWIAGLLGGAVPICVVLLLLVFPDGRLLSRRWRLALWLVLGSGAFLAVGGALSEYGGFEEGSWSYGESWLRNPLPVTIGEGHLLWGGGIGWPLFLVSLVVAVVGFGLRYRRSGPEQRTQFKFLLPPVVIVALAFLGMELDGPEGTAWLVIVGFTGIPIAIGLAILRYRLFDIDLLIRRSVVYAVLWVAISSVYLLVAALPGFVVGERLPVEAAIGLTVLATLVFQPARRAVDRVVGRLLFGERPSEFELLTRFGETVADSFDAAELAPRAAETVRQGLDVEWARVRLDVGNGRGERAEPAGAAGVGLDDPAVPVLALPLVHGDERLGVIECGPKRDGRFTDRDHGLLASLARQAALGIHNAHLAAELSARLDEIGRQASELQASRARLVAAQDTERQRLERDLHDGVQQDVVSLLARLGLARAQLRRDPVVAEATLADLQTQTGQVLGELRRLVQGIHPAVLSDRGLLEAVEARLAYVPLGVEIHADHAFRLSRFTADVETAAYFFVCEGLTNVIKHANARRVSVRLGAADGVLRVEVTDDGVGFVPAEAAGSGLTGLRDRIDAVGGRVSVVSSPGGGCRLVATIPATERIRQEAG